METLSAIFQISILLIVAALIGFFTAWFYWRSKYRKMKTSLEDELEKQKKVISEKQRVNEHHKARVLELDKELAMLQERLHQQSGDGVPAKIYSSIIKNIGEGISVSNESGEFLIFNPTLEKITGYSHSEANSHREKPFLDELYPDPELRAQVDRHIHEVPEGNEHTNIKTVITRKNREKVPVLASSTKVTLEGKQFYLTAYRDVSTRPTQEV